LDLGEIGVDLSGKERECLSIEQDRARRCGQLGGEAGASGSLLSGDRPHSHRCDLLLN
jgi:hypothetical protein